MMRFTFFSSCALAILACGGGNDDPTSSGGGAAKPTSSASTSSGGAGSGGGTCGNNTLEGSEACDTGGESAGCNADCTAAKCGDGKVNLAAGEQCDSGVAAGSEACNAQCKVTPFFVDNAASPTAADLAVQPDVAAAKTSSSFEFQIVWGHAGGNGKLVRLARRDLKGQKVGTETAIGTAPALAGARIAANAAGRTAVVWQSPGNGPAELRYRLVEPGGNVGKNLEQVLAGASLDAPRAPLVAANGAGAFCLAWLDTQGATQLASRCLDAAGMPKGINFTLFDAYSAFSDAQAGAFAMCPFGDHFYTVTSGAPAPHTLLGHELDPGGMPASMTQFPLSPSAGLSHIGGVVALSGGGYATIASYQDTFSKGYTTTVVRAFDVQGSALGVDLPVEDGAGTTTQRSGAIVAAPKGFLAIWANGSGNTCSVRARRFTNALQAAGKSFDIAPPYANWCAFAPRAAVTPAGDLMVVWILVDQTDAANPTKVQAAVWPRLLAQ